MKLRTFIKETLVEIAHGVRDARFEAKDYLAVAPNTISGEYVAEKSYVDFDVAVTVNEKSTTESDGKAGVKAEIEVFGSKLGGELGGGRTTSKEATNETVSRIVFKVPIYLSAHFRGNQSLVEEHNSLSIATVTTEAGPSK